MGSKKTTRTRPYMGHGLNMSTHIKTNNLFLIKNYYKIIQQNYI